jgi:hypothetical protein
MSLTEGEVQPLGYWVMREGKKTRPRKKQGEP